MKKVKITERSPILKKILISNNSFVFETTGRGFTANKSIIGINDNLEISQGYDGSIDIKNKEGKYYYETDEDNDYELTPEEKKELSLHMIELWKKFGGID